MYATLAVLAIRFATGGGQSSSSNSSRPPPASSTGRPEWLVGIAGLALIGSGRYHVYKGVTKRFLKEIDTSDATPSAVRLVTRLGQVGFPGKGVALAGVGGLLVWAAVTFDPSRPRASTARCARSSNCPSAGSC